MKLIVFLVVFIISINGYRTLFQNKFLNFQPKSKLVETIILIIGVAILFTLFAWIIVVVSTIFEWLSDIERSKIKLPYLFPWSDVSIVLTVYLSIYYIILKIHSHLSRSILRAYNEGVRKGVSKALDAHKLFLKDRSEQDRLYEKYIKDLLINEDAMVSSDRLLNDHQWVRENLMKKSNPEYFEDFYES